MTQRITLPFSLILYFAAFIVTVLSETSLVGNILTLSAVILTALGIQVIEHRISGFTRRVEYCLIGSFLYMAFLVAVGGYADSSIVFWIHGLIAVPLAAVLLIAVVRIVLSQRGRAGRYWFLFVLLVLIPFHQIPVAVSSSFLFLSLIPFSFTRQIPSRDAFKLSGVAIVYLLIHVFSVSLLFGALPHIDSRWNFVTRCVCTTSESLSLALACICVLNAIRIMLRPRSIRTRLRWAFLLNFLVPVTLMTGMYVVSVLYLIGGYQGASAKRILIRIGIQAQNQATQLWETINGINHDPPPRSPFYRAGMIQFEDGTVEEFGSPPRELIDQMIEARDVDIEFFRIKKPDWQIWIAGFHRDKRSLTAIAYRIDQEMLAYISDILGFDMILVPGFDYRYLLFKTCEPDQFHIRSPATRRTTPESEFAIGAAAIASSKDRSLDSKSIDLNSDLNSELNSELKSSGETFATLQVIASRRMLAESLMMVDQFEYLDRTRIDPLSETQQEREETITTGPFMFSAQSINYLNLIVFAFLAFGIAVLIGLIILSLSTSFLINRKINSSVQLIKEGTSQLRKGNLTHQIPVTTSDEFAELASDFNMMARSLKTYQVEREGVIIERIEQERLREEFETARLIQHSLLPSQDPILKHLMVTGTCLPVREVGGDYFDYIEYQDGAFGLAIGDVSGHGMSSGLLMSMAKSCLLNQVRVSRDIAEVIGSLNIMICDAMKKRLIMTFLYGQFSPDGSKLTFASAGHHFPYHFNASTSELRELESVAYPLGVRRELHLQIREISLAPGDVLVFYTDGIVEAQNRNNDMFGFERLEAVIRDHAGSGVKEIRDAVLQEVIKFRGDAPETDDVTIVILKVKSSE